MIDELPRRRLLVVLMHRHHAHLEPVGIEQTLAVASVLGCDHVDRAEHGEREILIAREMTKLHEQIVRMPLADTAAWFAADANRVRGEFVLVLAGAPAGEGLDAEALRVLDLLLAELPVKSAASLAAEITGAPRKALYAQALLRRREE